MKIRISFFTLIFITSVFVSVADAEELKKELQDLKNELSVIKKEIRDLKGLLEACLQKGPSKPPRPVTGKTSIKGDPSMGNSDAPLVLVEFSDYQCPYCGKFIKNTFPQIIKGYVETGKVLYVFKDFPLPFHKQAQKAAEAAHCAGEQKKYWEMHDLIFENQRQMHISNLTEHAGKLGLNIEDFKKCLGDGRFAEGIKQDMNAGRLSGVTGTPSFLLGRVNDRREVEGTIIRGALQYDAFKTAIDGMLKKEESKRN